MGHKEDGLIPESDNRVSELEGIAYGKGSDKFVVSDGDGHSEFLDTLEDARDTATEMIAIYRQEASSDGEWPGEVEDITIAVVLEKAQPEPGDDEGGVDFVMAPIKQGDT